MATRPRPQGDQNMFLSYLNMAEGAWGPSDRLQLCALCPPLPVYRWHLAGMKKERIMLKISARRDLVNEETGHQYQGSWARKQNSHFIPTMSWSCIPRDGPVSPTAPIMISRRLNHLSWMGFSIIYFFHLLCSKWLNLISCEALGR